MDTEVDKGMDKNDEWLSGSVVSECVADGFLSDRMGKDRARTNARSDASGESR